MTRSDWDDLPASEREAITNQYGQIKDIRPADSGNHADIASTVIGEHGTVFVKAARKLPEKDGPEVTSLRWEAKVNPFVNEFAPRLLRSTEVEGWLVLVFEHIPGRHPDYSPGSCDLDLVAKAVHLLQKTSPPAVVDRPVTMRWHGIGGDASPMSGQALLHTDINAKNVLITPEDAVYFVDWAFVSHGAPWVEMGQMIPWLLSAGHTPASAEKWLHQFPAWREADPTSIDQYARLHTAVWTRRHEMVSAEWIGPYLADVRRWASYRGVLE
ncbi:phosphotransferase [Actinomadura sp. KC345]|uniref:phosphotransferase n=1 Tax=Actinomadura sp. KC345 TaxID=2530371 RepID=UPI001405367E|nr:phosphotransferase [Actinomadura sp. KC345]